MNNNLKKLIESIYEYGMFDSDAFNDDDDFETLDELNVNKHIHRYYPKTNKELKKLIKKRIKVEGNYCDLNDIDTSEITDMADVFSNKSFNGDISLWDVSNVETMKNMFFNSKFNGDISLWDVSNVTDMSHMFSYSLFNGDISKWNVSSVTNMIKMFFSSLFNGNISLWNVSNVTNMIKMFQISNFDGDISLWKLNPNCDINYIFTFCPLETQPEKLCKN